jgi:hypothetical protein
VSGWPVAITDAKRMVYARHQRAQQARRLMNTHSLTISKYLSSFDSIVYDKYLGMEGVADVSALFLVINNQIVALIY